MKKLMLLCAVVIGSLFAASCEGPRGPKGDGEFSNVFEYRLSFNQNLNANIATQVVRHSIPVYLGDMVAIYVMEETDKNGDPIWAPLPIRFFVEDSAAQKDEELEYVYNYGLDDFKITARATAPLGLFNGSKKDPGYVTDMIFRVVYIEGKDPIQRSNATAIAEDLQPLSYDELLLKYNLTKAPVKKMY
ncbi:MULTISPECIES: hypothetical protein [unclassified Myroides]|uniref:hypothetical protein n=1 Tax=unclassified Myroides TaxID=2642485 RepID=UPI003D2F8278